MNGQVDLKEDGYQKYLLIAPLLKPGIEAAEKRRLRNEVLQSGEISERTLRRYLKAYQEKGFDGLIKKERRDKGKCKAISKSVIEEAKKLREELNERSVKRIVQILESEGIVKKGSVSRSTLTKYLHRDGFSKKELKLTKVHGNGSRRFQKENRNTLWQTDIKYGPYLTSVDNPDKKVRSYLLAIIDDATRYVVHAEFYVTQKLPILEDSFRKAVMKNGVPEAIYVDNGKIFISKWFRHACARINVRHIKAQAYSPESKGKIERFNRTVEEFLNEMTLVQPKNIEDLNKHFKVWLEEGYNFSVHDGIGKRKPAEAFKSDPKKLKFISYDECKDIFLWEITKSVDKVGCVSVAGRVFEAGIDLIRKKVDVRYDPFDLSIIEIWHNGELKKRARELVISEYNGSPKSRSEKPSKPSNSRLMDALTKTNIKRLKGTTEAISFLKMKEDKSNV